jgi:hypothetical protein
MKYIPPSAYATAFNCPHCSVLAKQYWFTPHAQPMDKDKTPLNIHLKPLKSLQGTYVLEEIPIFERAPIECQVCVKNMWFSQCFNCNRLSVWVYNKLYYPQRGKSPPVNPDTPEDIRHDYEEASSILDLSPRGAAALIRLGIQKLCKELGQPGKNINDDIGALVRNGLDSRVQQALDIVRVIGNEAVHPGHIDLRDDRATAETLFKLFNLIVEKMISEPKCPF